MNPISQDTLIQQLLDLGVNAGDVLLVHTSFSKIGPVEDGPLGLIAALCNSLSSDGTLVMPSMSGDKDHPFDAKTTPCLGMGVVADIFWRCPTVVRSDNPHALAASGPFATKITAPHPIEPLHGLNSPVGRVYELDGKVLLLGVGHDANTTVHLAESLAGVRYRRNKYVTILKNGVPTRLEYQETDHCCQNFNLIDAWLDGEKLQRRGKLGHGEARLFRSRDVVTVVTERIKANETVFLHPVGVDEECDDAWKSLNTISSR